MILRLIANDGRVVREWKEPESFDFQSQSGAFEIADEIMYAVREATEYESEEEDGDGKDT